ncbi:MAG TPA: rhodanese-like domain-containing protein [Terriglobia bacterium]|jgi:glyoxylase-like metal-dependent hydrolase (beta-lactamase superfamily II)
MYFRQFYLGCLAHASYLIGSGAEAAVVDPQRDVDIYIEDAKAQGLQIKHVIETHLHADFVSGHHELAARTGAQIYFGSAAAPKFDCVPVHEGDEIVMGDVILRFLETPGHTPESISVLIFDREKSGTVPYGVLTGDTLFIGDVGRPDLLGSRMAAPDLAGMLHDSLHRKLMLLPDETRVFPAHGAGSMCGRHISSETSSTIGDQRRFNYALQPMTRDQFIQMMTTDLPEAPAYFSRDARINLEGPALIEELPEPLALAPEAVQKMQRGGHLILDTRPSSQYGASHIRGSLNIALGGQFASWAGSLIKPDVPLIIIAENYEGVREARTRLARVGLEQVSGYLKDGVLAWHEAGLPLDTVEQISVEELRQRIDERSVETVIDVRRPPEWNNGHVAGAAHMPLSHLTASAASLDRSTKLAVMCAGGYRSSIACSLLEQLGFRNIANVGGGITAWTNAGLPVVV